MASEVDQSPSSCENNSKNNNRKRDSGSGGAVSSADESIRNRRFLANLQASLGGMGNKSMSPKRAANRQRNFGRDGLQLASESINSLEEALRLITLSEDDVCASLMDIKPFLQCQSTIFTVEEFDQIAAALCAAALQQSNIYFVIDICIALIGFDAFQQAVSECLKSKTAEFLKETGEDSANLPHFLAQLMVAKWPRKFNRVHESSNVILFTVFNTIAGWVNFLSIKATADAMDSEIEEAIFERCARGIISFCNTGQRFVWLNFPELYDQIFNVIIELLTKDTKLPSSAKHSLLQLHISMNKWSLANLPKYSNAQTQTINPFY